jgi:hypothetical protein
MSTTYVPTAIYHASIGIPSDGDDANAASVNTSALKYLSDNTALLKRWSFDIFNVGGTVTPSAEINFGGAGVKVTGGLHVTTSPLFDVDINVGRHVVAGGNVTSAQNVSAQGNISAVGQAIVGGNITSNANITAVGDVTAAHLFGGALQITGTGNGIIGGSLNVGGQVACTNLYVSGPATVTGNCAVSGNVSCADLNSSGAISGKKLSTIVTGPDANATFQGAQVDFVIGPSSMTADRIYTIGSLGARDGMTLEFTSSNNAHTLTIMGISGFPSGLVMQRSVGTVYYIKLVYGSGAWNGVYSIFTS